MKENVWIAFLVGFIVGLILVVNLQSLVWKSEAIDRGFAYYHPITAKFTWKTNMVEKVEINK